MQRSEASMDSDAAARERALDPQRSIALEAPAGSGKTSVLVQRFLRLLARVDEPEQILAITFTRKAAGEMRERVVKALRAAEGEDPGLGEHGERLRALAHAANERSARLGWALEASPGRLRIQTIDALNRSVAMRLPLAAHGAGERALADRPQTIYRAAARRALMDAQSEATLRPDAELLFERLDNDFGRFERLLAEMLQARAHWLPRLLQNASPRRPAGHDPPLDVDLCARVEASLRAIVAERMSEASALIPAALVEQGARLAQAAARRREQAAHAPQAPWTAFLHPSRGDALTLRHWQALAHLALTHQGAWRRALTLREGFPTEDKPLKEEAARWLSMLAGVPGARELLIELARLPPTELSPEDARGLTALSRVLRLAASELGVLFDECGRVDHTAVAAAARQALTAEGAPSDLALRLGADTRHILVDEFQDTSIEQMQLLEALTASWEEGDGRTLFVVGDPMQSIYQFREAEVGLFLKAHERGIGRLALQPLALTRNFRSAPELVAWTNRIFPACFPQLDDARTSAVRYRPSSAGGSEARGLVRWHATPRGDAQAEAGAIAALVTSLRAGEPAARIAILLSARSHAAPIVAALGEAKVGIAGVDLVSLGDLPVVRDLQALARALYHLGDRTAWLAVLRAPWCGLTLHELSLLAGRAPLRTVWEALSEESNLERLPSDARARLARTRAVLRQALAERDRLEPAAWVEAAWLGLGGPAACADDADLEHARAFFAYLAHASGEPGWTGPLALEEGLEELYAAHEAPSGAVEIMTIHRAKGLEFDHVILPGLGRKLRSDPEPLLRWLELPRDGGGTDLLMAPIPPLARRGAAPLREYLKSLQARRAAHERVRLIYVAATRARSQLHLFSDLVPRTGTLLAALWPAVGAELLKELPDGAATEGAPSRPPGAGQSAAHNDAPVRLARLAADWQLPAFAPSPPERGPTVLSTEPLRLEEAAFLDPQALQRVAGQGAEHAVCIELKGCARRGRPPRAGDRTERVLRERLVRLGFAACALEQEVARAAALWERCVADAQLQWIFSGSHTAPESPFELSGLHAGRLVSLTIDRSFTDADGLRWLVNFRPAAADAGEGRADLRGREELELEQAMVLAKELGAGERGAQEIRGGVYFPALQSFREVGKR